MVQRNINVAARYHESVISLMGGRFAQGIGENSTLG
jgi:hypothetical protein